MRIAFVSPVGVVGGAERVMLGLIARLRDDHSVTVVLMADGPLVRLINSLNVDVEVLALPPAWHELGDGRIGLTTAWERVIRAPLRSWQLGGYIHRLRSRLRELEPDIVHTNGIKAHLLGSLTKPRKARLLWHIHDYLGRRGVSRRLLRLGASRAAAAIAVSRSVADDVARTLPGLTVSTVPNFVDAAHFCPGLPEFDSFDVQAGLGPPADSVVRLGLVATYAHWKGHYLFLDALRRVVDALGTHRVRGYIVGGPIYRTDRSQVTESGLRRRIAELNLTECVGLVPFQSDPLSAYRALDVVVHASTEPEPFGLTIAEAMSCGRAVVAAEAGGVAEIIKSGDDGLLYRAGDVTELVEALTRLANDSELRIRLGEQARLTVQSRFNVEKSVAQLLEVYRNALK